MRYFMELKYLGKHYCGWQRQPQQTTVEGVLEDALEKLQGAKTEVVGAGRTDTGVNASYYVAHFDSETVLDTKKTLYKLNRMLPSDISVHSIVEVTPSAHARFSAREREYHYYISLRKDAMLSDFAWILYQELNLEKMQEASEALLDYEDFTSFAKLNSNNHTNICHLKKSLWTTPADGILKFEIRSDRFLRNMVRSIVGTLVDVGRGKYSVEEFRSIISARDLSRSSSGAPAQGLFLADVLYEDDVFFRTVKNNLLDF